MTSSVAWTTPEAKIQENQTRGYVGKEGTPSLSADGDVAATTDNMPKGGDMLSNPEGRADGSPWYPWQYWIPPWWAYDARTAHSPGTNNHTSANTGAISKTHDAANNAQGHAGDANSIAGAPYLMSAESAPCYRWQYWGPPWAMNDANTAQGPGTDFHGRTIAGTVLKDNALSAEWAPWHPWHYWGAPPGAYNTHVAATPACCSDERTTTASMSRQSAISSNIRGRRADADVACPGSRGGAPLKTRERKPLKKDSFIDSDGASSSSSPCFPTIPRPPTTVPRADSRNTGKKEAIDAWFHEHCSTPKHGNMKEKTPGPSLAIDDIDDNMGDIEDSMDEKKMALCSLDGVHSDDNDPFSCYGKENMVESQNASAEQNTINFDKGRANTNVAARNNIKSGPFEPWDERMLDEDTSDAISDIGEGDKLDLELYDKLLNIDTLVESSDLADSSKCILPLTGLRLHPLPTNDVATGTSVVGDDVPVDNKDILENHMQLAVRHQSDEERDDDSIAVKIATAVELKGFKGKRGAKMDGARSTHEEEEEDAEAEENAAAHRAYLIRRMKVVQGKIGAECKLAVLPCHVKADFMELHDCIEFLTRPKMYKTVVIDTSTANRKYRGFSLRFGDIILCVGIVFETSLNDNKLKIVNEDDSAGSGSADRPNRNACVCIPFLGTRYGFRGLKLGEALVKHILNYYKSQGTKHIFAPATASALKFWQRLMFCKPRETIPLKFRCFSNTTTLHLYTPEPNILYPRLPSANELTKLMRVSAHFMHFNADNIDRMEHIAMAIYPGEEFLGSTLVHEVVKMKPELRRTCDAILETKYTFNERDHTGRIALHYAVKHNDTELVGWLIKCKSNVNAQDNRGQVPLCFAAKYNCLEVVNTLIYHGALATKKDSNGTTPLDIAVRSNVDVSHVEAIKVLRIAYDEQKCRELAVVAKAVSSQLGAAARTNATNIRPNNNTSKGKKPFVRVSPDEVMEHESADNALPSFVAIVSDSSDDDHKTPTRKRSTIASRTTPNKKRPISNITVTNGCASLVKRQRTLLPPAAQPQYARENRTIAVRERPTPKTQKVTLRGKDKPANGKAKNEPPRSAADFEAMQQRALDRMVPAGQRINRSGSRRSVPNKVSVPFHKKLAQLEAELSKMPVVKRSTPLRRTILRTEMPSTTKKPLKKRITRRSITKAEKTARTKAQKPTITKAQKLTITTVEKPTITKAQKATISKAEKPTITTTKKPTITRTHERPLAMIEKKTIAKAKKQTRTKTQNSAIKKAKKLTRRGAQKPTMAKTRKPTNTKAEESTRTKDQKPTITRNSRALKKTMPKATKRNIPKTRKKATKNLQKGGERNR